MRFNCKTWSGTFYLSLILFIVTVFACYPVCGYSQAATCKDLHTGILYSYPKNSSDRYVIERDEKFQKEVILNSNDSILYEIKWKDDCTYAQKYVSGGKKLPKEALDILAKHDLVSEIESITADYYTYALYLDKKSNLPISKDTMWLHEKAVIANNELFTPYKTRTIPRKDHFSDTSKYAVLYIYRPGKFTNSLANFVVYLDDNILWVAKNNSGYVFKILKEGKLNIKSRLMKDESSADVDFKFGKVYYVRSAIKWGFHKGRNFKLEMEAVKPEAGQLEFDEVEFR